MNDFRERLQDLSPAKRALLEKLLRQQAPSSTLSDAIPRQPADAPKVLSFAEQRLWFVDQLEPDHPFYNLPLAAKITGKLDPDAFAQGLQDVVNRHETLRSTYHLAGAVPRRDVAEHVTIAPQYVDLREQPHDTQQLNRRLRIEARRPFVLEHGPLLRCTVFQTTEDTYIVLLVMHHIVSDGWSMGVMLRELATCYASRLRGREPSLPPLPLQYSDFAAWQQQRLTGEFLEQEVEHWRQQLSHTPALIDLPTTFPRTATQDFEGAIVPLQLDQVVTQRIHALARSSQSTPFMIMVAAYAVLLSRYARQNTVNIGTAVASRLRPELESLIGFFVNTLVIPVEVELTSNFSDLIHDVRETCTTAFGHQEIPFEKLVEHLVAERDRSHSPLFQVAFVLQNAPHDLSANQGLKVEPIAVDNGTAKSDLTFFLSETQDGCFGGHVEYRTSLFSRQAVEQLVESYLAILQAAVTDPSLSLSELPLLAPEQRDRIVDGLNRETASYPEPHLLHELFDEQTRVRPNQTALIHRNQSMTYAELQSRANAVAAALQSRGVGSDQPVIVSLPRSMEQIVASLAILKCGGLYVPIDPESPAARRLGIVRDVVPKLLICDDEARAEWASADETLTSLTVSELFREGELGQFHPVPMTSDHLAYMIFTSGSTGVPKGVLIEHRGIVNFLMAKAEALDRFGSQDRVMHGFSPCFDGSIAEVYMSLMYGATIVIVDREVFIDPPALTRLLKQQAVSVGMFSPTLLATLDPKELSNLRIVLSAGEALTPELARKWLVDRAMYNGYGPTEVSIGVSVQRLQEPLGYRVSIGRSMANMRMYILDPQQQPVPLGVIGEIYIGGVGVGRGYFKRPELTAERFLKDPFVADSQARMYRTGDFGRWREDGTAEFISRGDDQIKLRGFRIELGEIEAALNALPTVHRSVVVPWGDHHDSRRLVAYVVPKKASAATPSLEREQVDNWRDLFEQSHRASGLVLDREFDIAGWTSTYTGRPIPQEEMREWVNVTVDRIQSLQPKQVLEIGCGTGLLLLQIAPHCDRYVGTDILASSIAGIEQALTRHPELKSKVELFEQPADDLSRFADGQFDVIVLNSVVQYFPGPDYLRRVLEQAMRVLAPGGKIFLGDLRNLRLHEAWATSIEMYRSEPTLDFEELRRRVMSRIEREEELLVDPAIFSAIAEFGSRPARVTIQLKAMQADNELSRYRYDVTLEFESRAREPLKREPRTNNSNNLTIRGDSEEALPQSLSQRLRSELPREVTVQGILNPRVHEAEVAWKLLNASRSFDGIAALRSYVAAQVQAGLDPNLYFELAKELGYDAQVTWNAERADRYDVLLVRQEEIPSHHNGKKTEASTAQNDPIDLTHVIDWSVATNDPLKWRSIQQYASAWRIALHERLPDYMVPSNFVTLSEIPFTVQGKVDKAALPPPPSDRPDWAGDFVAPRDGAESTLVEIWEDLLDVRPIGVRDSFFALGGHSMLAVRMVAEVEERTGKALPLAALFRSPTIEHLAALLNDPGLNALSGSLVPLVLNDASDQSREGDDAANVATSAPLFCVHPAGGTVFCYQELAEHFRNKRPVYGLQAVGIDGLHPPHETLGEMAAHYARAIREAQPQGPYHLVGWSIGGVIAFEVARQLVEQGETLGMLALLDAGLLPGSESMQDTDFLPLIAALFPEQEAISLEELRQQTPEAQVRYFTERAAKAGIVPEGYDQLGGHVFQVFQANIKAVHEYLPQKLRGRMLLIRPAEQAKTSDVFDDPVLGWGPYADQIETLLVPGDHAHMLQSPAVEAIARHFTL